MCMSLRNAHALSHKPTHACPYANHVHISQMTGPKFEARTKEWESEDSQIPFVILGQHKATITPGSTNSLVPARLSAPSGSG